MKNNKKTLILIGVYTIILLAIIGILVFIQTTNNKKAVTDIYITTKDVQAGETVDPTFFQNKVKKIQYPVSAVKEIENAGGTIVTSSTQISALVAVGRIPKGQPLTKQLFEAITPSIYGDYTSKTFAKGTDNEWRFVNPDYIILSVNDKNTPINGFSKGEEISIEGYAKYEIEYPSEEASENGAEENVNYEGVYSGIITNHAVVHNLIYDESEALVSIGVIVEQSKYPLISTIEKNGELFFHSGYTEAWETTTDMQTEQLLFGHGLYLKNITEAPINLTYTDIENETREITLADFKPSLLSDNKPIYPNFIRTQAGQIDQKYDVVLTTSYPNVKITHYNINNGTPGHYMDVTGLNSRKSYNSETGLFTYVFEEDYAEGYYEITFGAKNEKGLLEMYQKVCFVIEHKNYDETSNLAMNLNFTKKESSSTPPIGNYEGYIETSVFDSLKEVKYQKIANDEGVLVEQKPTYKVTQNGYEVKYTTENKIESSFKHIDASESSEESNILIKTLSYRYNNVNYKIELYFNQISSTSTIEAGDGTTIVSIEKCKKILLYNSCKVIGKFDDDTPVEAGTSLKICKEIYNNYRNFAVELTLTAITNASFEKTCSASIKETSNYKTASFYELLTTGNSNAVTFSGEYEKEYFNNLLIRGIDLRKNLNNVNKLSYSNIFKSSNNLGTFGGETVEGVNLVLSLDEETELKIKLFYNFDANRYVVSKETVIQIANILNVDPNILYNVMSDSTNRLSEEDVEILFNSILNDDVVKCLDEKTYKNKTQDFLKLIGFLFTHSEIDLSNLYATKDDKTKMFHTDDLIGFIESLKAEFVLSNGEVITTSINVNN